MHFLQVIVEFAVVLGFMVLVHELGHFGVAKWCGVRVEAFSIGFGPRLFGIRHGDTDYRISLLPLGGYVKMAGDVPGEAASGDPGEFNAHPRWQRVLIAFAGPIANFILCFFLLLFLGLYHHETDQYLEGPAVLDYVPVNTPVAHGGAAAGDTIVSFNHVANPTWDQILKESALNLGRPLPATFLQNGQQIAQELTVSTGQHDEVDADTFTATGLVPREQAGPITIATVVSGTPADHAGLKGGDEIVRIDSLEPHSINTLHVYLKDRAGAPATLVILRGGQQLTVPLTPIKDESAPAYAQYQIGFYPKPIPVTTVRLPFGRAVVQSVKDNLDDSTLVLRILKGMFTRHVSVKSLSGPVGIAQQIDLAARNSYWTLVRLMSTISLQLGIFNLLPIRFLMAE